VLLRIIGVERERPPDRAVGIGWRKLVRIEQPCLRPVVEIGDFRQHVFRRRAVDNVATGEEGERPETRAATQEEAARGIGHEFRRIADEERGIDAGWVFSNACHPRCSRTLKVAAYRPVIMARSDFGTSKAITTWTTRKPTIAAMAKKCTERATSKPPNVAVSSCKLPR